MGQTLKQTVGFACRRCRSSAARLAPPVPHGVTTTRAGRRAGVRQRKEELRPRGPPRRHHTGPPPNTHPHVSAPHAMERVSGGCGSLGLTGGARARPCACRRPSRSTPRRKAAPSSAPGTSSHARACSSPRGLHPRIRNGPALNAAATGGVAGSRGRGVAGGGSGSSWCLVGAPYLAEPRGQWCYEVEVLEAQGLLYVGLAGTSLGPQCAGVGVDECSWGFRTKDGDGRHGCARERGGAGRGGMLGRCGPIGADACVHARDGGAAGTSGIVARGGTCVRGRRCSWRGTGPGRTGRAKCSWASTARPSSLSSPSASESPPAPSSARACSRWCRLGAGAGCGST
jgi:hypothetical protein